MAEHSTPKRTDPDRRRADAAESVPTWRNTTPRGNPEPDRRDMARSRERWEAVVGR